MQKLGPSGRRLLIVAAYIIVCVLWGSTYLAIKLAVATLPPFMMAATRYVSAGLIMYALVAPWQPKPSLRDWGTSLIIALLLLVGGNGLLSWGEQFIPSGVSALLIATFPLWALLVDWLWYKSASPRCASWLALIVGVLGVFLLVLPLSNSSGDRYWWGILSVSLSSVLWAIGSVKARYAAIAAPLLSAAMQMLTGGLVLCGISVGLGEHQRVQWESVSLTSVSAVLYLVVFGSLIGYGAYVFLVVNAPPRIASTYAFVNPMIAVLLGWLLNNEAVGRRELVASAVIVSAVATALLSNNQYTKSERSQSAEDIP